MKIGVANDHRGYYLKKEIYNYIHELGYSCVDYGTNDDSSVDYVDYAVKLCKGINGGELDIGILICGTGIGMSIAANKVKGIRCARVVNVEEAKLAKEHNMANVLAIGENIENVKAVIDAFINTDYSNEERHLRRIEKIKKIEEQE